MSRVCEFCGKHTQRGNKKAYRGKAKYLGGVGVKITGKKKRTFKPNLQKVKAVVAGERRRVRTCTSCLKAGFVQKRSPIVRPQPA